MIEFHDSGPVLDEHDLIATEAATGRPLPKQYRDFLLAHNGGRPTPDVIDMPGTPFKGTGLHTFYCIHPGTSNDLLANFESTEGCRENQLLPIAYDAYGREFILVLAEEEYGHVYYFELTGETPIPYLVAKDFNEFLSKIRAHTPEELAEIDAAALGPDEP